MSTTLGTGTFGRVRLVRYKSNGKVYALKIIKKYSTIRMKQTEHILAEKEIMAAVEHCFLVNCVGYFQDPTCLYLVMEYVPGGEFFTHLRSAGRFPTKTAKIYGAEVIIALGYLHSQKIAYRDLKPENLLIDEMGHLKVTDFGFAKRIEYKTWTLCGTPEYLAPEIILSAGHNTGVDWWAIGILIYELLAGYPPFYADDPLGIYQKILDGKVKFPNHVEKPAKDLIKKLLQKDTTKRLGMLKNGVNDIKSHKWFNGLNWDDLEAREGLYQKGPISIAVKRDDDTSHFDEFPDSFTEPKEIKPEEQALFSSF